jgi:hypothetical protein
MKYAAEMGSGAMIYTKFHKCWFRHSKVNRGDSQAHKQHGDSISLLYESRLKMHFELTHESCRSLMAFNANKSCVLFRNRHPATENNTQILQNTKELQTV